MSVPDPLKFQLVVDEIHGLIASGLPRGARLPTERELSERLRVSRPTVRRALQELRDTGEVVQFQGSGTFVGGPIVQRGPYIRSFSQDMAALGKQAGSILLRAGSIQASTDVSWRLRLRPGTTVFEIVRLRTAEDIPICIETAWMSADRFPGLLDADLTGSLYETLSERFGVVLSHVTQELQATAITNEQARHLNVAPFSPALLVDHVAFDQADIPVECTTTLYRGDRYTLRLDLLPDPDPRG